MRKWGLAALLATTLAGGAYAHTTYVLPAAFYPDGELVQVEAAYATTFFTPEVAVASPNFHALRPDGQRVGFDSLGVARERTSIELFLRTEGTYRFTTGERMGDVATMAFLEGQWRALAAGETPPEGVDTSTLQTVTVAEAYITKGLPTRPAVDATIGRLAIRPVTHPNQVLVASGFEVELLFDGAPFPNMPFVLYRRGDPETDLDTTFVTNEQGRATLTFDQPGVYLVTVRYRANAPEGSAAAVQSYTTSLTFEVMTELPPPPPPPPRDRRSRRERRNAD